MSTYLLLMGWQYYLISNKDFSYRSKICIRYWEKEYVPSSEICRKNFFLTNSLFSDALDLLEIKFSMLVRYLRAKGIHFWVVWREIRLGLLFSFPWFSSEELEPWHMHYIFLHLFPRTTIFSRLIFSFPFPERHFSAFVLPFFSSNFTWKVHSLYWIMSC